MKLEQFYATPGKFANNAHWTLKDLADWIDRRKGINAEIGIGMTFLQEYQYRSLFGPEMMMVPKVTFMGYPIYRV